MRARFLVAGAAALLMGAAVDARRDAEPRRFALIVGAADYKNFGAEPGGDLPGARNDALAMQEVLTARWGFKPENVRLLLNEDATRAGIEDGLRKWLPSVARPGDLVVFYFSGHGSRTIDRDGDEDDGMDETICPTDVLRSNASRDIRDDQLGEWFRALPTQNVTVILDSCHSGTATRSSPFARAKALGRAGGVAVDSSAVATRSLTGPRKGSDAYGDGVLEISAAQPDQYAMEAVFERDQGLPRAGGAFTTPLVKLLWQVPTGTSHEEIFRLARTEVKRRGFAQNPQMTLRNDRVRHGIFAVASPASTSVAVHSGGTRPNGGALPDRVVSTRPAGTLAFVPVVSNPSANQVQLGGGAAAGVTLGSLYRVGGRVLRIVRIAADRAVAELVPVAQTRGITVSKSGAKVEKGDEAPLIAYAFPEARLTVSVAELASADRGVLAPARSVPGLTVLEDGKKPADLLLRREGSALLVLSPDGSVRHTLGATDGAALAAALRQEAGARRLAALENPARPFSLDFSISGGDRGIRLGEGFEFRARSGRDGYLTVVDLGTDGKVTVIFPNDFEKDNRVRAGAEIVLPTPGMKAAGAIFEATPPAGQGIVRAFVTARPLELGFAQGGAEGADAVARALRKAAGEPPVPGSEAVPVESWTTTSLVYEIRP